jgi:hypothetical protein
VGQLPAKAYEDKDNTKLRHGISHKIKWDGLAESFKECDRIIQSHCRQNGLGYLLVPRFMLLYVRYGTKVFVKAPEYQMPGLTIAQF